MHNNKLKETFANISYTMISYSNGNKIGSMGTTDFQPDVHTVES